LWDVYAPILRLDAKDPVAAWREHVARLRARAEALNARGFEAVRLQGPGTELMIGGPEVSVDALDAAGRVTPILRGDVWVLE
jgi:leucyl aminopeptidase (aminopeptidase T)